MSAATTASTDVATLNASGELLGKLAEHAVRTAKKLGADSAKASWNASQQKRLVVEAKDFSLANSLASRDLAVVVHKDSRKGSAMINIATEAAVEKAVADALALARYSVPNDSLSMPDAAMAPTASPLKFLFDDALAETPLRKLQEHMQATLALLTADKRVALDRYEMAITASHHGLVNSNGVHQNERQTSANWTFFGMARDGEEVSGFDYISDFAFAATGLDAQSRAGAEKFAKAIVSQLKPRQAPTYKGPILLTPRAVEELFIGLALYHAGGRNVMDGKSRWAESIGKRVLSPLVTLVDRPHDARFSGASSFDADGLPTTQRALFDKGVLTLHLHDCESAKRCKTKPNGMAGGPFALTIEPGKTAKAGLGDARSELLVVDRFSGNTDPVKGDFSGVAKSSRLLVGGKDAGSVTETMIAGNFFELADAVLAVSAETENVGGSMLAPWMLIDNVSVTGN